MSLRVRLTLFYTTLLAVMLVLFGWAVYHQVTKILIDQVDIKIIEAAQELRQSIQVDGRGRFWLTAFESPEENTNLQLWDDSGLIVETTQQFIIQPAQLDPFDPEGLLKTLETRSEVRNTVVQSGQYYRVITIPIRTRYGTFVGVLQSSASLDTVGVLQSIVLRSLIFMGGLALMAVAAAGLVTTRQALSPLSLLTQAASEITRADDLSRRIPLTGPKDDEIGKLIHTFNQTIERLEKLFHTQRRFIADVGHELRTPLTVLKGNMGLMRRLGSLDKESIGIMEGEIDRLSRMVRDLLLLAQVESGSMPIVRQQVELDTLLLEVYQEACILSQDLKSVVIEDIDQVMVCGDKDRLKQVALNLVSNAVTYTPEGGEVKLKLGKKDGWGILKVEDNGPGISDEDLNFIFDRFYRAEKSRSRSNLDGTGYGLGLSIAKVIVERHGGEIKVETTFGVGTTFIVTLPLADGDCPEHSTLISQDSRWLAHAG